MKSVIRCAELISDKRKSARGVLRITNNDELVFVSGIINVGKRRVVITVDEEVVTDKSLSSLKSEFLTDEKDHGVHISLGMTGTSDAESRLDEKSRTLSPLATLGLNE